MAGAGSVYRHDYEEVSDDAIWDTARKSLEPLLATVETKLARLGSS